MLVSEKAILTTSPSPKKHRITISEFTSLIPRRRILRLRKVMQQKGLDGFIVSSMSGIRYLTGFSGSNGLLVVAKSDAFFLTDSRYGLQAKQEVNVRSFLVVSGSLFEEVGRRDLFKGCRRVGFDSNGLTYAQYRAFRKNRRRGSFVPTSDVVEELAVVKESEEIENIRSAVRISDLVFDEVLHEIHPGISELDIAAEISYRHRSHGAEEDAFEPIVASGERGALPHARPTTKKIRNGELLTLDFGCTVRGYNSDITRTIAVGRVSANARRMYDVVHDAQQMALDASQARMFAKDLDAVARDRIKREGYGKFFTHSLGHGLGLQVHELPRISYLSNERLSENSVITIEPGVYVPNVGGVRIEDDVLVTARGCEVLSSAPKELIVV
jgi:Xaa-Pro aminopeptidase